MSSEDNKPEEQSNTNPQGESTPVKPSQEAAPEKPSVPSPTAAAPVEKPTSDKPAEKAVSSATAPAPAAAPAKAAEPAAPPAPPSVAGVYGKFLKEKGIESTPLPQSAGVETMELKAADLPAAAKLLRESPQAKLDFLVAVTGVDSQDTYDSVYHLWSYSKTDELVVKVRTAKATVPADKLPEVPSLANYWSTANWHERETYDLVGVRFIGHPYLRRILNPWDWEGYPLRRDYKQPVDALNDKNPESMR